MNAYEKIRAALRHARDVVPPGFEIRKAAVDALAALAELEKAASPQFVAGEVTRPMCHGAWARYWSEPNNGDSCGQAMRWLEAWRSELGPALGLVEIREPTPEECERIYSFWLSAEGCNGRTPGERMGRIMFDAAKIVMWPKEGL